MKFKKSKLLNLAVA